MLAPNPGPFTGPGTNTYLVGDDSAVVVLDPGPKDRVHEAAIVEGVGARRVVAVVVTHTHPDHAPLANPLAAAWGVPAMGYAPGPEFEPDLVLRDGDLVDAGSVRLQVVATPGHSADHVCFLAGGVLFTGDHVLGSFAPNERTSVMVEDVEAYLASLERLRGLPLQRILPGHGERVDRPHELISWYIAHRRRREEEILQALVAGCGTVGEVVARVYGDVDEALHPLAARSVEAHLRKLAGEGRVHLAGSGWDARVEVME